MIERYEEIDIIIEYIHKHIEHPLTLSGLAKYVAYSPYHFTRIFKERTGLPPLYYISSLRLQKAKELLLRTNLNIRDIALEIGQQSLGTFTTRFTEKVGVTPADFRNSMPKAESQLQSLRKLNDWYELQPGSNQYTRVEGTIQTAVPFEGVILIGLFTKPIPEGLPLYGTLVSSNKKYFCFSNVKPGIYYLMATSVSWGMLAMDFLLAQTTLRTRSKEPVIVGVGSIIPYQQVVLYPPRLDDPPILISLPLLMRNFLNRVMQNSNL